LSIAIFATVPERPRYDAAAQIIRHATDQVVIYGLLYGILPTVVSNRLVGVGAGGEKAEQTWTERQWDVK
jgi:hypothetical protein